jgi:hypothetical protein
LPGQATTGLTSEQFDELVERVGERIVWDSGRGRPRELTLYQAVKAVVMYFRTNITQELIAELLFVDQSTISRAISDLEEIIAEALDEFVPELPEEIDGRVAIVDESLCPCWSCACPSCTRAIQHYGQQDSLRDRTPDLPYATAFNAVRALHFFKLRFA